jgi:hypothetical protein
VRGLLLSAAVLAAVVAATAGAARRADVTIAAQPLVLGFAERVTLFGTIGTSKEGELVTLLVKECGVPGGYHAVSGTQSGEGGRWTTQLGLRSNSTFRAMWGSAQSAEISVQQRAAVQLLDRGSSTFLIRVFGVVRLDGKRVTIERYDRRTRLWKPIRTIVLGPSEFLGAAEKRGVKLAVPKGTTLRAVLPLAQARPCYLAGYSPLVRT